jgi:hypothetical protein
MQSQTTFLEPNAMVAIDADCMAWHGMALMLNGDETTIRTRMGFLR